MTEQLVLKVRRAREVQGTVETHDGDVGAGGQIVAIRVSEGAVRMRGQDGHLGPQG